MKILYCTPEAEPFAQTGGLGEVAGSLPRALAERGHDVRVALPRYGCINARRHKLKRAIDEVLVDFGPKRHKGSVLAGQLPGADVPVYFIENGSFFGREGLYGVGGQDYSDNHLRFGFFSLAAIWMLKSLSWAPDVIICNEWQTALVPTYLRNMQMLRFDPFYENVKTLFTIHNLAYQGLFEPMALFEINLPPNIFTPQGVEYYGKINLMKAGIVYGDRLATVSPRYAREIQTERYGRGLHGILSDRAESLTGIVNGLDYAVWNPAADALIAAPYGPDDLAGKAACKARLQKLNDLRTDAEAPLIGAITCFADRRGLESIAKTIEPLLELDCQVVALGDGMPEQHKLLSELADRFPERFSVSVRYDDRLAHEVQAGCDIVLMPSEYEPCGAAQLRALKYGAIPVVRQSGGLAGSVVPATPANLASGKATGFAFKQSRPREMLAAVERAVALFRGDRAGWRRLMQTAMTRDFSWDRSAELYEQLLTQMTRG